MQGWLDWFVLPKAWSRPMRRTLPARYALSVACHSESGPHRTDNQDEVYLESPFVRERAVALELVAVVADGMGGHAAGGLASRRAIHAFVASMRVSRGNSLKRDVRAAVMAANAQVFGLAQTHLEFGGMGTTLSALCIRSGQCVVVHVGDSRIYHLDQKRAHQLTTDHTWLQERLQAGVLRTEELVGHPDAHVLTRAVGTHEHVDVDIRELREPVQQGDRFLLCSDGLHGALDAEAIWRFGTQGAPYQCAARLSRSAIDAGSTDNVSVVLIEVEAPMKADVDAPANTRPFAMHGSPGASAQEHATREAKS